LERFDHFSDLVFFSNLFLLADKEIKGFLLLVCFDVLIIELSGVSVILVYQTLLLMLSYIARLAEHQVGHLFSRGSKHSCLALLGIL
jgi:hypothetical protein